MLPDFLVDSYKCYKADTAAFLGWLVLSAQEHGYSSPCIPATPKPTPTPTPRLKGKARKEAKDDKMLGNLPVKVVPIVEFVPLSSFVRTKSQKSTPHSILKLLERIVRERKRCFTWYEHVEKMSESNDSHSYFIDVLQSVRGILMDGEETPSRRPLAKVKSPKKPVSLGNSNEQDGFPNYFSSLEVEDDTFGDLGTDEIHDPNSPPKSEEGNEQKNTPSRSSNFKLEDSEEDMRYAVFCMLDDLNRLRKFVSALWKDYRAGSVSLVNASITTSTAVEFARNIEMGFYAMHSRFHEWCDILRGLFPKIANTNVPELVTSQPENAEIFYILPYTFVTEFSRHKHLTLDPDALLLPFMDLYYDPDDFTENLCPRMKWNYTHVFLGELLPDYFLLAACFDLPAEDEVTTGLTKTLRTGMVYFHVVFGVQLLVDIHVILGQSSHQGFEELRSKLDSTISGMEAYEAHESLPHARADGYSKNKIESLRSCRSGFVERDIIMEKKRSTYGPELHRSIGPGKPFFLFRQCPLLCGILTFSMQTISSKSGLTIYEWHPCVSNVAHLYNATKQEGLLDENLQAIDCLIEAYGQESFFCGAAPTARNAYQNRHSLMLGASIENFAKNRRKAGVVFSKKGRRNLEEPPIFESLRDRFCKAKNREYTVLPDKNIESMLHVMSQRQGTKSMQSRRQWDNCHKLRPIQLLEILRDSLAHEESKLDFDYFKTFVFSWDLLKALMGIFGTGFTSSSSTKMQRPAKNQMACIPHYVFSGCDKDLGTAKLEIVAKAIKAFKEKEEGLLRIAAQHSAEEKKPEQQTDVPELGPTTMFGILKPNHPTRNGECIHIGICYRQLAEHACSRMTVEQLEQARTTPVEVRQLSKRAIVEYLNRDEARLFRGGGETRSN